MAMPGRDKLRDEIASLKAQVDDLDWQIDDIEDPETYCEDVEDLQCERRGILDEIHAIQQSDRPDKISYAVYLNGSMRNDPYTIQVEYKSPLPLKSLISSAEKHFKQHVAGLQCALQSGGKPIENDKQLEKALTAAKKQWHQDREYDEGCGWANAEETGYTMKLDLELVTSAVPATAAEGKAASKDVTATGTAKENTAKKATAGKAAAGKAAPAKNGTAEGESGKKRAASNPAGKALAAKKAAK